MEQNGSAVISAEDILRVKILLDSYKLEMAKHIVGQEEMVEGLLTTLVAGGHCLIEGAPGLAKTLAVKTFSGITGLDFKRIQFTPDLLPADLTGTLVWEPGTNDFFFRKGPIFSNIVFVDELNRAPAKVQSALLEAMEENQVTAGDNSYILPEPFLVLATQNPIEHEGTYPLPEAQLDRFLLKLIVHYPSREDELGILRMNAPLLQKRPVPEKSAAVLSMDNIEEIRRLADLVHVDENIERYMISVIEATRPLTSLKQNAALKDAKDGVYRYISYGASPRAVLAVYRCSKIRALFSGSTFVKPEDVKKTALPVMRHRLILSYEADAEGLDADAIISRILAFVPAP